VVIEFLPALIATTNRGAEVRLAGLDPSSVDLDSPLHRSQRYLASAYDSVASLFGETYPALSECLINDPMSRGRGAVEAGVLRWAGAGPVFLDV
jgi:hypothetical protein